MPSDVKVRFAPSPTGFLHVGNVRTALINWLFARKAGGTFVLRLDDTDAERSTAEYAEAIKEDLTWLGLNWDESFAQSSRLARYEDAAEALKQAGRLYPCYETEQELETRRKLQLARKQPPIYDRAALKLTDADKAQLEAEGRKPHWRFKLEHKPVTWEDLVRGGVEFDVSSLSDPVLVREDGTFLYTLPSVVDDVDYGVTHILRGEDHVANTAAQIQIFEALRGKVPTFGHTALLTGAAGEGLSKRIGSLAIRELRAEGIEPLALNSLLARIGTADPVEPRASMNELVEGFDISRFGRAPAKFDPEELWHLNAKVIHLLPFDQVKKRLDLPEATPAFWEAVKGNLTRLGEAQDWWQVVNAPLEPVDLKEERSVAAAAADVLTSMAATVDNWPAIVAGVKEATGAKGRALFHPLRLALTGRETGPELKDLLPLIGKGRAIARLKGEKA